MVPSIPAVAHHLFPSLQAAAAAKKSGSASEVTFEETTGQFCRAPTVLKSEVTETREDCVDLCGKDTDCALATWCNSDAGKTG